MNDRIKELAEEAGLKVESWMTNPPKPFQILGGTEEFEKFAELIVRECMELTKECSTGSSIHDLFADEIIAEHFGVEE